MTAWTIFSMNRPMRFLTQIRDGLYRNDVLTREQRSYNMSRISGRDTKPEILLRTFLSSKGIKGYRTKSKLEGRPDLVFTKQKIAIFVDGCFWHKCSRCYIKPKTNSKFWSDKINSNVERDKKVNRRLRKEGWKVIRFWEHELKKGSIHRYHKKIVNKLNPRLSGK